MNAWRLAGFRPPRLRRTMRMVVPGVMLTALGVQTMLSSFLIGIMRTLLGDRAEASCPWALSSSPDRPVSSVRRPRGSTASAATSSSGSTTTCAGTSSAPTPRRAWRREELAPRLRAATRITTSTSATATAIEQIFDEYGPTSSSSIHTAAQPSHDWAARDPHTDFTVNANGTLTLLDATRRFCPDAAFIFTSTNKVYGDRPNALPLVEQETRWEIDAGASVPRRHRRDDEHRRARSTRCSARRRWPPTCWCRNTAGTSA